MPTQDHFIFSKSKFRKIENDLKRHSSSQKHCYSFSFWSKHETTLAYDLLLVTPRRKSALTAIGDAVLCGPPERAPRVGPPPPTLTWKAHLKCTALPYRASQLKHKGRRHVQKTGRMQIHARVLMINLKTRQQFQNEKLHWKFKTESSRASGK